MCLGNGGAEFVGVNSKWLVQLAVHAMRGSLMSETVWMARNQRLNGPETSDSTKYDCNWWEHVQRPQPNIRRIWKNPHKRGGGMGNTVRTQPTESTKQDSQRITETERTITDPGSMPGLLRTCYNFGTRVLMGLLTMAVGSVMSCSVDRHTLFWRAMEGWIWGREELSGEQRREVDLWWGCMREE